MATPLNKAEPRPKRRLSIRWLAYSAIVVGVVVCTAALRQSVTLTNVSGERLGHVVLRLNDRTLFEGPLEPGESIDRSFSTAFGGEYVVATTYEDGPAFWQSIGYVDPWSPSDARLDLGINELTYNGSVTKTGSSRPRVYSD